MSKILLANPKLPQSWIDLSVGEPHLIRDILLEEVDIEKCMPQMMWQDFLYPSPCGYDKLVEYLESKHGAKVIITNGAKQGLGAAFYAIKKLGNDKLTLRHPYWALIPPLADLHQLELNIGNNIEGALLEVSPNNPDGSISDLNNVFKECRKNNVLMIHDAAYYTNIYTLNNINQDLIGDVQIYSVSKMFGLSSLRLGYAVCQNQQVYEHMQYYMEHMTVGVSKMPQMFLMNILNNLDIKSFELKCFNALERNRQIVKTIHKSILEVPNESSPGMFLWAKINNKEAFFNAKLHIIDGEPFGDKNYIRINLAFKNKVMQEIVDKLNFSIL